MKNTIFVILAVIGFNNAFAECNNAPYIAPVELQPPCAQEPAAAVKQAPSAIEGVKVETVILPAQPKAAVKAVNPKKKQVAHTVKKPLEQ